MAKFTLPYGKAAKGITITISDEIKVVELHGKDVKYAETPSTLLQDAVEKPIGNVKPLPELVKDKKTIVVVVDDYTREFPRDAALIPFFDYLTEIGVSKSSVTIIIGTATHAPPTDAQMEQILGKKIPKEYNVVVHDPNAEDLVEIGTTSRGTPVKVNKTYHDADCKILLTDVSFHYYAGFGGDRKSILPAVCGADCIANNHGLLVDPAARTGNLDGNPVHLDMAEAAKMVGADFVINIISESGKEIIDIKAGELGVAFLEAARILKEHFLINVDQQADLAIISDGGYPKDINLYQGTKGLTQSIEAVKQGGNIVYLAEASEGIGNPNFEQWIDDASAEVGSIEDPLERAAKAFDFLKDKVKTQFVMGGHKAYYLARECSRAKTALLSSLDPAMVSEKYFMEAITYTSAKTMQKDVQAFIDKKIEEIQPKLIYVIPHGGEVLVQHQNMMAAEKAIISDAKRKVRIGPPFITKYEKSRIVGARALQLALGAPALVAPEFITPDIAEPIDIADLELREKVLPIIIRRTLPSKEHEDYPIDVFPGDATAITRDIFLH
ncbi:MAG TPA: nickel-dependent lactate racemase [Candidatus Lokiarchaeia archaeon]|nr:nickel-dependent lactate racemase [Candidatus Lokiarchaeia archaeon]